MALQADEVAALRQAFDELDSDKSGKVRGEELRGNQAAIARFASCVETHTQHHDECSRITDSGSGVSVPLFFGVNPAPVLATRVRRVYS